MTRVDKIKLRGGPLDGSHYDWDAARKGEVPIDIEIGDMGVYRMAHKSVDARPNQLAVTTLTYTWVEGGS